MTSALLSLILAVAGSVPVAQEPFKAPGRNKLAWASSPNFNPRPEGTVVDTIVLHHTASSSLEGVVKWFATTESQVSAHYTIGKDGSIVQHVNTFYRAWHAGASLDKFGRTNVNNFSVGIEIVNVGDGKDPWTPEQVEAVRLLCGALARYRYKGQIKQIVSHEYIATPPGRKPDPKNYPWESLNDLAKDLGIELIYGRADQQPSGGK